MIADLPFVSIGLPTHNGGRYIGRTLDSLLAQDYTNFKILVSDNASSDGTEAIVRGYADHDARIQYERWSANMGAVANFNRVLARASGEYFMWAADHDLWDARYVSSCVAALESDLRAVLAYVHTMLIDEDGGDLAIMDDELGIHHGRALERYLALIWRLGTCNAIYGVMRLEAVVRTGGFGPTPGPDHLVLAKMALQGTFIQLPDVMFFRRRNRPPETPEDQRRRQPYDLDPLLARSWLAKSDGQYYRGLRDGHLRAVLRAPLPMRDKIQGIAATLACFSARFGVTSRPLRLARGAARLLPSALRARIGRLRRAWLRGGLLLAESLRYSVVNPKSHVRYWVVSCARNPGESAIRCLDSVYGQDYGRELVTHVYIDDASTDDTEDLARAWLATHPDNNVRYIRNQIRLGGTANTVAGFSMAPTGSVVAELNGDDWLPDRDVLRFLDRVYADAGVWMTYNTHIEAGSRGPVQSRGVPKEVLASGSVRRHAWASQPLQTFRRELFSHLDQDTFIDPLTGQYWKSADDQAIYLAMLELAGTHSRHINRITYVYNHHDQSDDVIDLEGSTDRAKRIRAQNGYRPLADLYAEPGT